MVTEDKPRLGQILQWIRSLQNANLAPDNFAVDDNTKQLIRKYEERFEQSKKTQEIEEHSRFPLEKE